MWKIHLFAGRAVERERRKGSSRRQQPAYGAAVNEVARELLRSARSPKRENGGRRYIKHDGMIASPVGSCLCCWQLPLSSSFWFCILVLLLFACRRASSTVTMHIDLQAGLLELVHPGASPVASLFLRSRHSSPSPPAHFQSGPSSSLEAGDVATPVWAWRLTFLVQSQQDQLQTAREDTTRSGRLRSRHSGLYAGSCRLSGQPPSAILAMSSLRTIIRSGRWCAYCRQPPKISITPSVVRPKEVPLSDQLQDISKDEPLCCFRDCDFISGDCLLSCVDCILSYGCDEQCSSVPLRGRLRKSTANTVVDKSFATPPQIYKISRCLFINVWKSIAGLPSPSVQIADLWTPFTGFILIVRISPTKRETKSDEMYEKKRSWSY